MEKVENEIKSGRSYNNYTDKQMAVFLYFHRIKLLKAAPAARKAGIHERTAQVWAKRLRENPEWNIFEKQTNLVNRQPPQLQKEHKQFLINLFDERPQATIQDAVDELTKNFEGLGVKKTTVGDFITCDCNITIKRLTSHPRDN